MHDANSAERYGGTENKKDGSAVIPDGEKIVKRFETLEGRDSNFRSLWQDVADLEWPRQSAITTAYSTGVERTDAIFDTTAVFAGLEMASGLLSSSMPVGERFFLLRAKESELAKNEEALRWFDYATERIHSFLLESNYLLQTFETLRALVIFGTGNNTVKQGKRRPLAFRDYPIGTYVATEDDDGEVDTVYRKFQLTAAQCAEKHEEEGWEIHEDILKEATEVTKMETKYEFIHAVEPRHGYNRNLITTDHMPYSAIWVDRKYKKIAKESGQPQQYYNIVRYWKASDEVMGRSPGIFILPIVRKANVIERDKTEASNKHVNPALKILDSFEGEVKVYPSAKNYVKQMDAIERMEIAGSYPIAKEELEEHREIIRLAFGSDLWNLFSRERTQTKSARETIELAQEKLQKLAHPASQLQNELYSPQIRTSLQTLRELELIDDPPAILQGQEYEIEYLGALFLAQQNNQAVAYLRTVEAGMQMGEQTPDILDNINMDVGYRQFARSLGVRHNILKDPAERDEMRSQRAVVEQRQQQLQEAVMMAQASQAVPNLAKGAEVGSPLEALQGAA